ncbi:FecR domain-containing protein [Iodobacter sp. CM08]|uniref:FecR family protein n=1 Tax=Iodobacter sp. CM08 TaxID=3085902 RepID=UPI0029816BD8|nr:FecR domain-containing protein [Iodobacter sp. CM08]MDW5418344.1 FecR domain-containing protein [Iodobacter sp. CM08]
MSESIDFLAAQWLLRQEQGLDSEEQAALQQWIHADAKHHQAWREMTSINVLISQLPSAQITALQRQVHAGLKPKQSLWQVCWQACSKVMPQMAVASCAMLMLVCSLLWFERQQPRFSQTFTTAKGEFSRQTLPDGSTVELDTASQIQVSLYGSRREVQLLRGQAMFHVSKDTDKPFHVLTGKARVTVLGTQFAVRNINQQVSVAVQEGKVKVAAFKQQAEYDSRPVSQATLLAGDAIVLAAGELSPIKSVTPASVGCWRSGRLTFDNTPLKDALAEFERYMPSNLQLTDPKLGELRISGSFEVSKLKQFTAALPQVLPVRIADGKIMSR